MNRNTKQNDTKPKEEELLTVTEAAKRLRVKPITISRWIKNGTLEPVKLPQYRRYRIQKRLIESIINPL